MEICQDVRISARFIANEGKAVEHPPVDVSLNSSVENLAVLLSSMTNADVKTAYIFFVNGKEIRKSLTEAFSSELPTEEESIIDIKYNLQVPFRVRGVTRCAGSLSGHTGAVLTASFSADGKNLASGSGDATVRLWDVDTKTPVATLKGHKQWVLVVEWSPTGSILASGDAEGVINIWTADGAQQRCLKGHKQAIRSLAWQPLHLWSVDDVRILLASASQDHTIRIWNTAFGDTICCLSSHIGPITCIRWAGDNMIYSGSYDKTIKVWDSVSGGLQKTLSGHSHRINTMSLRGDFVLRTSCYEVGVNSDTCNGQSLDRGVAITRALARYLSFHNLFEELLATGSDDTCVIVWNPKKNKPLQAKMTGHNAPVNEVKFSPDGRLIASVAYDRAVKIWNADGQFLLTFRGHVQRVYQVSWSSDSRLLVSSSKDSTLKVWSVETKKLVYDLPGHADEVFAVDWSPDSRFVVSGGKDMVLKMWAQ